MALSNLFGWNKKMESAPASSCGSACGASDKPAETPAACGAADKPVEAPETSNSRFPFHQRFPARTLSPGIFEVSFGKTDVQ